MLLQATLSPQLLAGVPVDLYTQKLFCNLWLGLLYDFAESCVVLLPGSHATEADYLAAVGRWPTKYKKRAQELVTMLHQRRRFVPSQAAYSPSLTCLQADCQAFIGVSAVNPEAFHLTNENCASCPGSVALAPRSLEALEYFVSEFSRHRRGRLAYVLGDGQWTQSDFEREVLRPILTTAKHVKIYDRWIGRSAFDRNSGTVQFNSNYKRTLEWIIHTFQNVGGVARAGIFEIYCGIERHLVGVRQRAQLRTEMKNFEIAVQSTTGVPVKLILKEESQAARCPHGRYLVTDQASVVIDRGFDLLWDDRKMQNEGLIPGTDPRPIRDVAAILCNDCKAVEAQTRMLPAL
jgi:hypothetical protein